VTAGCDAQPALHSFCAILSLLHPFVKRGVVRAYLLYLDCHFYTYIRVGFRFVIQKQLT
jgi:hypothetical protein